MPEPFFADASILRIRDAVPVKATFLETASDGHFFGFCTLEDGKLTEARTLFANVGASALIPNVSSVFLGNRLGGKTPVFFVIENGYELNKGTSWFNDAACGQNGFWKFLKPAESGLVPALEQGKTVWKNAGGQTVCPAVDATVETVRPVLVWQAGVFPPSLLPRKTPPSTLRSKPSAPFWSGRRTTVGFIRREEKSTTAAPMVCTPN